MKTPFRIVVCGASGRMGARVAALAAEDARFALAGCVGRGNASDLPGLLASADALVDFSSPAASLSFAAAAASARRAAVIGTTGFSKAQLARLKALSKRAPILVSPNFSPGVNLLFRLAAEAARRLPGHDARIVESHHKAKKDAPSGTALRLARAVSEARGGAAVPAVSLRLGDVVGEHTLTLAGPFERLELTHRAHSRDLFARGALDAALWLKGHRPGLYDMGDALGL